MKKLLKLFILTFIVICILAACFLFAITNSYITSNYLLNAVNKTLKVNIKAEKLKISLLHSYIEADNFSYYKKGSNFRINFGEKLYIKYNLSGIFSRKINIEKINFDNLNISYEDIQLPEPPTESSGIAEFLKQKIDLKSLFKYNLHNINFKNLNIDLKTRNSSSFILKNAYITIPHLAANTVFEALLTNGQLSVNTTNDLNFTSNNVELNVKTSFKDKLLPKVFETFLTAKNINGTIKKQKIAIPKLTINSSIEREEDFIKINKFTIKEYNIENNSKATNLNLKGNIEFTPLTFNFSIEANPVSNTILNFISNYSLNKIYKDSELIYMGEIDYNNKAVVSEGNIKIKNINHTPSDTENTESVNLEIDYSFNLNQKTNELNVDKLLLNIQNTDNTLLKAVLNNRLSISLTKDNFKILSQNSNLSLKIENFNLNLIKYLLTSKEYSNIKKLNGIVSAELDILTGKNNEIKVTAKTHLVDLYLKNAEDYNVENVDIVDESSFKLSDFMKISLNENQLTILQDGKTLLSGSFTGIYDIIQKEGELTVNISKLYKEAIEILPILKEQKINILTKLKNIENCYLKVENIIKFSSKEFNYILDNLNLELYNKNNKAASITATAPLKITQSKSILSLLKNQFNFIVNFYNFDLNMILPFFNFNFSPNSGLLSGIVCIDSLEKDKTVNINGSYNIDNISFFYDGCEYNNLRLKQMINASISKEEPIKFKIMNFDTSLKKEGKKALSFILTGSYINSPKKYNLEIKDLFISAKSINELPFALFEDELSIKTMDINGSIGITKNPDSASISVENKLSGNNISFCLNNNNDNKTHFEGSLKSKLTINKKDIDFEDFKLQLSSNGIALGKLNGSGKVYIPFISGKSKLKITLSDLKLKEFLTVYNDIKLKTDTDFRAVDYTIDLTANNISYGKKFNFDMNTNILKENNIYSIRPIIAKINGTNIFATFNFNANKHPETSFHTTFSFKDMNIAPYLEIYNPEIYSDATGIINKFDMELSGKNLTNNSLKENLNGKIQTSLSHLSFNDNLANNDIFRLLFLPFEVFLQAEQLLATPVIPDFIKNITNYSESIFSNTAKLRFKTADIDLSCNNGIINLNKCFLKGNDDSFNSINFDGTISLNKDLDLTACIFLNNFVEIPIKISGKISSPKTNIFDIVNFIKNILVSSTASVIEDSENALDEALNDSTQIAESITL